MPEGSNNSRRWMVVALAFAAIMLNYVDRQIIATVEADSSGGVRVEQSRLQPHGFSVSVFRGIGVSRGGMVHRPHRAQARLCPRRGHVERRRDGTCAGHDRRRIRWRPRCAGRGGGHWHAGAGEDRGGLLPCRAAIDDAGHRQHGGEPGCGRGSTGHSAAGVGAGVAGGVSDHRRTGAGMGVSSGCWCLLRARHSAMRPRERGCRGGRCFATGDNGRWSRPRPFRTRYGGSCSSFRRTCSTAASA